MIVTVNKNYYFNVYKQVFYLKTVLFILLSSCDSLNNAKNENSTQTTKHSNSFNKTHHHDQTESICGRVPLYKTTFNSNNNRTWSGEEARFKILHGADATKLNRGEFPWIAQVVLCEKQDCGDERPRCTGTLLNKRWVITAGHCSRLKTPTTYFRVTFGRYDLFETEKSVVSVNIDKWVPHPDYENLSNDLLLLRLEKPVYFNNLIQPACLLPKIRNVLDYTTNKTCFNVGYVILGLTEGMVAAKKLQKIEIKVKSANECNKLSGDSSTLRPGTLCIGPPEGKIGGACKGDSGGPDICFDSENNRWVLIGTVSYGPRVCDREKNDLWLTVSVDLAVYRNWILETIKV